jgi:hypothetical protein
MDADGDGKLTPEEFDAGTRSHRPQTGGESPTGDGP